MTEDDDHMILEAEMPLMAEIHSCTSLHRLPIMTLGSGRGTLVDKYLCVLHAMFLEAGATPMSLQNYTELFVVGTFDLGVEFSLNALLPDRIQNLLPWASFSGDTGTDEAHAESEFEIFNSGKQIVMLVFSPCWPLLDRCISWTMLPIASWIACLISIPCWSP